MLRAHSALFVRLHRLLDLILTAGSFIAAYLVKKYIPVHLGGLTTTPNYYEILFLIIIIWHVTFLACGLYESYRKRTLSQIIVEMIKAVFIGMSVLMMALYLLKITDVSRLLLVLFCLFNIVLLGISKSIVYRFLTTYRRRGFNYRNILVVGSKERAKDIIDLIRVNSYSGLRVTGCLEVDENAIGREVADGVKVIGLLKDLHELLLKQVVDEIIFAMPLSKIQDPQQYMLIAEQVGVSARIIPDWQIYKYQYQPRIAAPVFENFFGNPTLAMAPTTISQDKLLIKYAFDYLFAALAFVVSLPLFIMIPLAIKAFSKGPVFYRQERCGLNGRRFMIYKFRSMLVDAEARQRELKALNEADGPVFKIKNDPRIIPYIGKLLRKTVPG
jgi:hypothetical protein